MNYIPIIIIIIPLILYFGKALINFYKIHKEKKNQKKFFEENSSNNRLDNKNVSLLKNNFSIFQNEEEIKIKNTGRNLCSEEELTSIEYTDYCKNIII